MQSGISIPSDDRNDFRRARITFLVASALLLAGVILSEATWKGGSSVVRRWIGFFEITTRLLEKKGMFSKAGVFFGLLHLSTITAVLGVLFAPWMLKLLRQWQPLLWFMRVIMVPELLTITVVVFNAPKLRPDFILLFLGMLLGYIGLFLIPPPKKVVQARTLPTIKRTTKPVRRVANAPLPVRPQKPQDATVASSHEPVDFNRETR
jgi:hypothetical protein